MMKLPSHTFFILFVLLAFGSANAMLYAPALPSIANFFAISADAVQQTVTVFLFGYTIGQLLYGPLANRFGRIQAVTFGCLLQLVGCVVGAFSFHWHSLPLLFIGRFLMALGSAVGLKITFTLVTEYYSLAQAGQKMGYLIMAFAVVPAIATALCGILTQYWGWVYCFYALAAYGLGLLWMVRVLPETKTTLDKTALRPARILRGYWGQMKLPAVVSAGAVLGGCSASIYLFSALGPFIAITQYGMSEVLFGFASGLPPLGLLLGSFVSVRWIKVLPLVRVIQMGLGIMALAAGLLMIGLWFGWGVWAGFFLPVGLFYFGQGHVYSNTSVLGMNAASDKSNGSAILNFENIGLASLAVLSLGVHMLPALTTLAWMYGLIVIWNLVFLSLIQHSQRKAARVVDAR